MHRLTLANTAGVSAEIRMLCVPTYMFVNMHVIFYRHCVFRRTLLQLALAALHVLTELELQPVKPEQGSSWAL